MYGVIVFYYDCRITLGLGGYGIQFGVPSLSGNLYINIFVIAMLGSPVQFVCMWLQNR